MLESYVPTPKFGWHKWADVQSFQDDKISEKEVPLVWELIY